MLSSSPSLRTLVIDDDPMSRELLTLLLVGEGYQVDTAESGEAALTQLSQSRSAYDVILTDLQMPGIAGAELAQELRRTCGFSPLLLAMSGSQPSVATVEQFDGFLLKPFPMEYLAAALHHKAIQPRDSMEIVPGRRGKTPRKNANRTPHQSCTSPVTSDGTSIAASAAQDASNIRMAIQAQEQQSLSPPSILNGGPCTSSVLDQHIYLQLAGSMPAAQLQEMYILCVNDARKRIASMRTLVTERDNAQFIREAHAIKGGSGMLGASELHHLSATLEACGLSPGEHGRQQEVNSLDELCAACDRLERILGSRV